MTTGENGEQMSVTISMPGKNISVTTDSAEEIGNILRLAGINIGGGASGDVDGDGDHDLGDHAAELSLPGTTGTGGEEPVIYVGAGAGGGEAEYGDQASNSPLTTNAGNTDSEEASSDDAEEEKIKDDSEETKEAVGDKSYTSKGGTVTQTATGLKHQAGSGTYGGTETDDEEKARKEAEQEMAKKELPEAAGAVNFDKVLDAIAALYGDDMWNNDSMQDLAHDLEQQKPTEQELDSIIATGELPQRLANTQFTNNDSVQFGEAARILQLAGITNEAQSAAQKAAFAKMIAKKKGNKSDAKADDKDDNKKPDADGDGIPDWVPGEEKKVKEDAPTGNSIYGQSVYEAESEADRILALSGVAEGRLMNSPDGTSMPEPKTYDSLPSKVGVGAGHKDYGQNRANNQGENPMGMHTPDIDSVEEAFTTAMGEYRKFVAENISRKK